MKIVCLILVALFGLSIQAFENDTIVDVSGRADNGGSAGSNLNYFFEMPDLALDHQDGNEKVQLQAFRSSVNDIIIREKLEDRYSELQW